MTAQFFTVFLEVGRERKVNYNRLGQGWHSIPAMLRNFPRGDVIEVIRKAPHRSPSQYPTTRHFSRIKSFLHDITHLSKQTHRIALLHGFTHGIADVRRSTSAIILPVSLTRYPDL